ncbi:ABC-three component system protein [Streptomyces atroolivaceus]|uniref:ABC-three component system protein n=1 Tax=Streptomyces atroolivaceus TaxID=66869 RepID=UPI003F4D8B86
MHFHRVHNRRRFLEEEIQELTNRLAARRQERADLGEDQARLLRELADGGALEALTALDSPRPGRGRPRRPSPPLRRSTIPRSQPTADHHRER